MSIRGVRFSFRMRKIAFLNFSLTSRKRSAWIKCCYIALAIIASLGVYIFEAQSDAQSEPPAGKVIFIEPGSVWKYLDKGIDLGTAWRAPSFDDSTWASGPAELGYGDGDEMTVVGYGPSTGNKYITTYFRHSFNVTDASRFTSLFLRIWRDDGAVVYLNGAEVWRVNMPAGPVVFNTRALTGTFALETTTIGPEPLVNGANVLAVEIHQIDSGSSDISFDFEISGADPAIPATVTRGPYLQQGTSSSVIVRWRTDVATNSCVRYGTTPGELNIPVDNTALTTEHEVTLTTLFPDTKYYYSVGTTTLPLVGNDSHFFITPPEVGVAGPTRIWAVGEAGTASAGAKGVRSAYTKFAGDTHTDLWLMLGNNASSSGLDSEYQEKVFEFSRWILRKTVLWPTLGNQDTGGSPNPNVTTLPYFNIFSLPTNGLEGGFASATEKYYSFNYRNIHFICLDSMSSNRSTNGPLAEMANWLRQDLAANQQPWVIAYWNHPPYSKGSCNSDSKTESIQMRQNIVPILEDAGVDLVISGQSRSYERSFLINGHHGSSSTFNDIMKINGGDGREMGTGPYTKPAGIVSRGGTVYVVAGSGGQTGGGLLNHPAMFKSTNTIGSLVIDINGDRLDARFLSNANNPINVMDDFTIIKGATTTLPPAEPSGLTATQITASQIDLAWTDNSNNETGFRIEQSTDGLTFTLAATTSANATTCSITGLSAQTTYYFRVIAFNSAGDSDYTNTVNATTLQEAPASPTGLTATAVSSSQINLAWADNSNNETGFRIEQSTDGTNFALLFTTSANVTTYPISNLASATTYHYRVRAFNSGGDSANSNVASATTLQAPPAAPTGLTAVAISGSQINLAWADNSNNETGFRIEQATDGVNFTQAATTSANATTRSITGLATQTTYHYRVRAFNSAGDSGYSNTASATTTLETIPTAPSGLTGTVVSASGINLSWQDKSNNEQGFKIERCLGAGCVNLTQIAQVGPNITTFSDTGLSTNSTYRYRVRAFNGAGNSSYSNSIERKTTEAAGAVIVRLGSVWKYLDNGSNQGTAWRETSFDDSAWASGPAKLGYGDGDEATVVGYGPAAGNKYFTTYFRYTFNVLGVSLYQGLTLQLKRDDGAVVYLNGVEVWRVDMPAGTITYTTAASAATDAQGFLENATINPSLLVNGTNVIAVEIHQVDRGSSDIALDLQLLGTGGAIGFNLQPPESHRVDDSTSLRAAAMTNALILKTNAF